MDPQWFVLDVNPYPWKVPPVSVGRRGGKMFPSFGRDEGLFAYKQSIKEQLARVETHMIPGSVALYMWFWRNMPTYTTHQGRTARRHEADTTNLQKATEDALQGILFENDKDVDFVQSYRVMQGQSVPPMLVLCAAPFSPATALLQFPDPVRFAIDELINRKPENHNEWSSTGEVPF